MKIYQVGGSVRDRLRGRQPQDYDYVVTGASPEEMLARGFVRVGKEIKTGCGHADFSFIFDRRQRLSGVSPPRKQRRIRACPQRD